MQTPHPPIAPQAPTFIPSTPPPQTAVPTPTSTPLTVDSVTTIATLKPQPSPSASPTSALSSEKHEFPTQAFLIGLVILIAVFAVFFVRKRK